MNNLPSDTENLEPFDPLSRFLKQHRRRKKKYGLLYLLALFFWMRAADLGLVLYFFPRLTDYQKQQLLGPLVITACWTALLLVAIALRQQWARYVLAGNLLLAVVLALSTLPGLPDSLQPGKLLYLALWATVTYLPVALVLIVSKNIQKLTEK